ncbi:MAG: enoyl-CoA hydratase/isomerase family protein [Deltaproteobacteria bacterium]|nr:enoyl-CoA hydratase/isomerase family protein [Deltaproteobacteria bacterium]MBW2047652.1 enoyl-CoA hydratase/isomerase family protein [Deltaproteobacteria bacterium]MBW2110678.1 enoyl-CoA hydratase/isomerase family protein [Deltaproteobacteria bacterium]MBW2351772.1 enoyl-CoA hydratase/isomerase family protein [Deltaproteobacteria bacterium]HDZ90146.1 enoyl-CoA hydratase/isomerase family protein [Deltaproteobacteria bacterium]
MGYDDLTLERQGPLATVLLNPPDSLNTLSLGLLRELRDVAWEIQKDHEIRVVILTGAGEVFSAGLNLKDPEIQRAMTGGLAERRERVILGPQACQAWEDLRPVTIAAIEGFCIGGGVSLVISCDFRIMGQSAYMRIPEIDLGLNYSWGSIPRLLHLVGPAKTKEMVILTEKVDAEKCLRWGLCEETVPDGKAVEAAQAMARKILKKPSIPVEMTKRAVTNISTALDRAGIHMDGDQFLLTTYSEDCVEGKRAFLEKRPPRFKGS